MTLYIIATAASRKVATLENCYFSEMCELHVSKRRVLESFIQEFDHIYQLL